MTITCSTLLVGAVLSWKMSFGPTSGERAVVPKGTKTFAISWTGGPTSWDPLDFDSAQNLFAARMLYATPMEASADGALTSRLFQKFEVSQDSKTLEFVMRPNIFFEDGSPITSEDVGTSIARMAFVRPNFPVLESIEGLEAWLRQPNPLQSFPSGIEILPEKIILRFRKPEFKPLFRFTLEPFAVIPRRCIDLKANKLICDRAPESGPYRLEEGGIGAPSLSFARRSDTEAIPKLMRFIFVKPNATLDILDSSESGSTVLFGNDLDFSGSTLEALRDRYAFLPIAKSWHGRFLLNIESGPFKDRQCRQIFADTFRDQFQKFHLPSHQPETSIFTQLTQGYRPPEAFKRDPISASELNTCLHQLKDWELRWVRRGSRQEEFANVMSATCELIGIKCVEVTQSQKSVQELLKDGVGLVAGSTGFWPLDPLGDLQMLFTPNMHKHLASVASDPKLQSAIRTARERQGDQQSLKEINDILFDGAIYNVYTHHQYFYVAPRSQESSLRSSPLGVTVPYPWQVFKM